MAIRYGVRVSIDRIQKQLFAPIWIFWKVSLSIYLYFYNYINIPSSLSFTYLFQDGADIILTNSYQASVDGYMKHLNLSREESFQLICTSVKLARKACSLYLQNKSIKNNTELRSTAPYVIGSVGPYAAILNDGSEYRGAYKNTVTKETLQEWHRDRLKALCEEGVDGLAVETIPSRLEAESITELLLTEFPSTCFWVSFQCKDEQHLAHGGLFSEAALSIWRMVKAAGAKERCCGIGVNCLHPQVLELSYFILFTLKY